MSIQRCGWFVRGRIKIIFVMERSFWAVPINACDISAYVKWMGSSNRLEISTGCVVSLGYCIMAHVSKKTPRISSPAYLSFSLRCILDRFSLPSFKIISLVPSSHTVCASPGEMSCCISTIHVITCSCSRMESWRSWDCIWHGQGLVCNAGKTWVITHVIPAAGCEISCVLPVIFSRWKLNNQLRVSRLMESVRWLRDVLNFCHRLSCAP